jgi:Tol biopolymer transport system component
MEPDGSDIEQLTDNEADDLMPGFPSDSEQITFVSTRDGNSEIYTMNADGSNQTRLTKDPASDHTFDWQPLPATPPQPDITPPRVTSTVPTNKATGV